MESADVIYTSNSDDVNVTYVALDGQQVHTVLPKDEDGGTTSRAPAIAAAAGKTFAQTPENATKEQKNMLRCVGKPRNAEIAWYARDRKNDRFTVFWSRASFVADN